MKILVVEDKEDNRNLLMKQFRAYDHEVTAMANGAEALEQALAQPPDIILSDILMPKTDGYQLCRKWKQNEQLKNIPFVFYSATYTSDKDKKFALSLGASAFILKPAEPDILIKKLCEVFEKAKSGALAPAKVAPLESSIFLPEYTKRVVAKLEKKVAQLGAEITRRKQVEEELWKQAHLASERAKELSCLYSISLLERQGISLEEMFRRTVGFLPPAWQYPEVTCARLTINSQEFSTKNFRETNWKQTSDILVQGDRVGNVEVCYLDERPEMDEGPFLKEERELVNAIARQLSEIIERKRAEGKLRESEEKWRSLVKNAPNLIIIVEPDSTIQFINRTVSDISVEETVGRSIYDFIQPEHHEVVRGTIKRVFETEELGSYEIRGVGSTGSISWYETQVGPIKRNGRVVAVILITLDITERKMAEGKIKRAAEEWRTTFDSITDFVSICDKDFRLTRVNKAFADLLKKKPAELIGKHCYEVIHGTNGPVPNCPHKKTIRTKKPAMAEFFEPHLGIHLEVATSPIFDEKGDVVASVHITRDITERKRMEEQLIVTDRLASIGELASSIAHELNNPLTSVIGFSELLLEKDVPDDVKEDLKVINREAQRTAGVVRNLLTFARKHPEERELININGIIEKVLELRAYEQRVSNIEVNTQLASDLPEVMANSFELQQVFINIVINAEHFMIEAHGRGNLTITTERAGDIIRASFADDGPGIAKKNLGHLFDPFFTTKEIGKGTGLGLSICHGIVTAHGGRIYAESKSGKGATFVVELPVPISGKGGTKNGDS